MKKGIVLDDSEIDCLDSDNYSATLRSIHREQLRCRSGCSSATSLITA